MLLLMLALAGCADQPPPTVDATSEMTLKNSLGQITSSLTEEESEQFEYDFSIIMRDEILPQGIYVREFGRRVDMEKFRSVHGLNAKEIHAKAQAIRAGKS